MQPWWPWEIFFKNIKNTNPKLLNGSAPSSCYSITYIFVLFYYYVDVNSKWNSLCIWTSKNRSYICLFPSLKALTFCKVHCEISRAVVFNKPETTKSQISVDHILKHRTKQMQLNQPGLLVISRTTAILTDKKRLKLVESVLYIDQCLTLCLFRKIKQERLLISMKKLHWNTELMNDRRYLLTHHDLCRR